MTPLYHDAPGLATATEAARWFATIKDTGIAPRRIVPAEQRIPAGATGWMWIFDAGSRLVATSERVYVP